jgi:polygalacturonase
MDGIISQLNGGTAVTCCTYAGNITMEGNAPVKIKSWPNTTGEVSNILYEDVTLLGADTAIDVVRKTPFFERLCILKTLNLPRQVRDKRRKS